MKENISISGANNQSETTSFHSNEIPSQDQWGAQGLRQSFQQFNAGLCHMELELIGSLDRCDLTCSEALRSILESFSNRLDLLQWQFLGQVDSTMTQVTHEFSGGSIPEMAAGGHGVAVAGVGLLGGALVGPAVSGMTVATVTTGFWWWKTTTEVTLAAKVAAALGIAAGPVGWAIVGVSALVTALAARPVSCWMTRRGARQMIMEKWRNEVRPGLESWAENAVFEAEKQLSFRLVQGS